MSLLVTVPEPEHQGHFKLIFGEPLDSFGRRHVARLQGSLDDSGYKIRMKRTYIDLKKILNILTFQDSSLLEYDAVFTGIYRSFLVV